MHLSVFEIPFINFSITPSEYSFPIFQPICECSLVLVTVLKRLLAFTVGNSVFPLPTVVSP